MEENPSRVSRKDGTTDGSSTGMTRRSRYPVEDAGDLIECSGEYCRSCTASLLADCLAVCCCPCAVVNLVALAFVKDFVIERDGNSRKDRSGKGTLEIPSGVVEGEGKENFCARCEADRVWLELYQLGHLSFGGAPCSGIQGKGN
ncbi:hypothetical protein HHK36_015574 [Tetracentron sinense]|uniref:Uncharacterized protein n=1 Tax=Tetracentron sinense TaxID=13715 RepID=A0A834Z2F4_TETSI|nr:hypothetical protein HHK36_015574 [Tetracentron sinense]